MNKRKLLFTLLALSLGCLTGGSRAMAQNGWDAIYSQTQTTSKSWTALSESSTKGKVLGASGATTYYYVTGSLDFTNDKTTNDVDGNSGLKILGTVYLYIPSGLHIFCKGANANGSTGAGAGIELTEGNTLYIIGGGKGTTYVEAQGGNAANGDNGGIGTDATGNTDDLWTGTGGTGGNGGGGAGAGIGSRGGKGGNGGSGGSGYKRGWTAYSGTNGSSGEKGSDPGAMGKLYVDQTYGITVKATGGAAGSSGGNGGQRGHGFAWDGAGNNYTVSAGAGGGGGGFGGGASNIGTGGPGGGGGGGGAGGAVDWRPNSSGGVYDVTAYGGKGGQNANGSYAAEGAEAPTTATAQSQGWVKVDNGSFSSSDWHGTSGDCSFGSGGSGAKCGKNSSNGTTNAGKLEYNITYHFVMPEIKTETAKYSPSSGTNIVLPRNREGYQWALLVYGKDCHATGTASVFTTNHKVFYGGNFEKDLDRTILLKDVYGDLEFQEVAGVCGLDNMGDNKQLLDEFFYNENVTTHKYPITVRLKDRTLYQRRSWNTICLPFELTPAQFSASPLAGATVMKMSAKHTGFYENGYQIPEANIDTKEPVLILWFEDAEPSTKGLQKGKPYLVKWNTGSKLVDDTEEKIHQLDFNNVTITEKVAGCWEYNDIIFQGTFSQSEDLEANDKTILFLGPGNKLYYPSTKINVGSCRGYFMLPEEAAGAAKTRGFVLGLDGDGTTNTQKK